MRVRRVLVRWTLGRSTRSRQVVTMSLPDCSSPNTTRFSVPLVRSASLFRLSAPLLHNLLLIRRGLQHTGTASRRSVGRSLSLLLDADSQPVRRVGVGDQLKAVVHSLSLFCSTRLQHTASRRRRSAKNRSLSIRCGLQHTGTASRRSVVLSLFCSTRTPAHGESGSAIN